MVRRMISTAGRRVVLSRQTICAGWRGFTYPAGNSFDRNDGILFAASASTPHSDGFACHRARFGRINMRRIGSRLELLETRRLLAATLNDGLLRVTGEEDSANTITVLLNEGGTKVVATINGTATEFDRAAVRKVIVHGGDQNDTLTVSAVLQVNSVVFGHDGDDVILSGGGERTAIFGGDGNDTITARGKRNHVHGGDGNDTITGTDHRDRISGGDGADVINAAGGDDVVFGNGGADNLSGGDGNDLIHAGKGDDTVDGGAGNDRVFGHDGADHILAGEGDDRVWGGKGVDTILGGDGNDFIHGGRGADSLDGGAGDNRIRQGEDKQMRRHERAMDRAEI
jgi:Ca2+-binding RTX toxin-like protein